MWGTFMKQKLMFSAAILTGLFVLVSCGGGGSSSSPSAVAPPPPTPSPPPPPPPTNNAPVISLSLSEAPLIEGKVGVIDASASTDADGDELTFAWIHISGPELFSDDLDQETFGFRVPNLTKDESTVMQLQVFDGTTTVAEAITLDLIDFVLTPEIEINFVDEKTIRYTGFPIDIVAYDVAGTTKNFLVGQQPSSFRSFGYDTNNELEINGQRIAPERARTLVTNGLPKFFGKPIFATTITGADLEDNAFNFFDLEENLLASFPGTLDVTAMVTDNRFQEGPSVLVDGGTLVVKYSFDENNNVDAVDSLLISRNCSWCTETLIVICWA